MFNVGVYSNRKGRGVGEYQRRPAALCDLLPWAFFLGKGLIVNKDGALQKTIAFRGPDLASSTKEQLVATRGRVNNALRRLGSNWCLHIEARRRPAPHYPQANFPDAYSTLVDDERRRAFEERSIPAFESDYFLTFTYLPPAERVGRAEAAMMENAQRASGGLYAAERTRFLDTVENVVAILEGFMPFVRALDDDETLTYLHDCISDKSQPIKTPEVPFGLDAILADSHLIGGLQPKLGRLHVRTIGVNAFIGQTVPGVLDALNRLPFAYRWVSRFLPLDKQDAVKAISTMRQRWFAKRKGIWTLVKEAVSNSESPLEDADAVNKAADANAALEVLGADLASFGYFTPTITIADEDLDRLEFKRRAVQQILDQQGLVSRLEDTNAVEAWLSSLPGQAYANCRRPLVSSANLVDLMPLSAVWAGPAWDEHFNEPPLMLTHTAGSTPFRFALHQGDVGHTMIVGPTGAGKSVLLNFMAFQFRRYRGAQVFFFDKGSSARAATHFVGGDFYALGSGADDATFQPLAEIDTEQDKVWGAEWLGDLVVRQGVTLTPDLKREIWDAVNQLASRPREQRTLTLFRAFAQSVAVKAALEPFAGSGPYADILDAHLTTLRDGSWQAFEMEALYNRPPAVAPTLDYLFHRLESRFDGRPTLLVLDEAWLFLDDPLFAGKIREWLKTLRRRNVSVVFASQNAFDQAVGSGFANIQSDVNWLFATITILTLVLTAILTWVWGEVDTLLRALIKRILLIGFVGYLINNWHSLTMMVVDGMTQLGLKAGGSAQTFNTFLNSPEQIVSDGFNLAKHVYNVCNSCSFITNASWLIVYLVAVAMILLAMFWLAIQVFVTTLEFKIVTLASMIFVPFAVWQKTTFLSDRALGYVFSVGAKLLTLALVVTIGSKFLTNMTVSATPNLENAAALVLGCFTVLVLALSAGSLASALVSGGPQLGAGSVVGAAAASAAMGGAAYLGGRTALRSASGAYGRYQAGARAAAASGEGGGSMMQRAVAGVRGAAFPSSAPPSSQTGFPSADPPNPRPGSGGGDRPSSAPSGGMASKTVRAAQAAAQASRGSEGANFGRTGMHNDTEG